MASLGPAFRPVVLQQWLITLAWAYAAIGSSCLLLQCSVDVPAWSRRLRVAAGAALTGSAIWGLHFLPWLSPLQSLGEDYLGVWSMGAWAVAMAVPVQMAILDPGPAAGSSCWHRSPWASASARRCRSRPCTPCPRHRKAQPGPWR